VGLTLTSSYSPEQEKKKSIPQGMLAGLNWPPGRELESPAILDGKKQHREELLSGFTLCCFEKLQGEDYEASHRVSRNVKGTGATMVWRFFVTLPAASWLPLR
jgi:hypothetical protein